MRNPRAARSLAPTDSQRRRDLASPPGSLLFTAISTGRNERGATFPEHPRLIIEVLSRNENEDLVEKRLTYRAVAALEADLVANPWAESPTVSIFRKADGWEPGETHIGMEAEFELRSGRLKRRVADWFAV